MRALLLGIAMAVLSFRASAATKEIGPIVSNVVAVLTDGATIPMDASVAFTYSLTLGGNHALENASNQVAGSLYTLLVRQDGTGSRTLSYGSLWRFPSATPPTLSTAAGALDALLFVSDGTYLNFLSIAKAISSPVTPPSSLAVTPGVEQCALTWQDNTSDETGFELMACQDFAGACDPTAQGGPLTSPAANATSFTDDLTGLSGETFRYAVRAKRGGVVSAFSNVVSCLVQ
jgi:hypothetical protein